MKLGNSYSGVHQSFLLLSNIKCVHENEFGLQQTISDSVFLLIMFFNDDRKLLTRVSYFIPIIFDIHKTMRSIIYIYFLATMKQFNTKQIVQK